MAMAEPSAPIPSAVILPDPIDDPLPSPPAPILPTKRRQHSLSTSDQDLKRPRLSIDGTPPTDDSPQPAPPFPDRRKSGHLEERKRGQRLFGALLGTLSQSASSSTAQRRRADIERKQQSKLKALADEYDEKKKVELERLLERRRREQRVWEEESMRIRHRNELAVARFLHTEVEPRIYYKPWELLPDQESRIKTQVEEEEARVQREEEEFRKRRREEDGEPQPEEEMEEEPQKAEATSNTPVEQATNGATVEENSVDEPSKIDIAEQQPSGEATETSPDVVEVDLPKEVVDEGDGGEVVLEAEEDTVIY